MNEKFDIRLAHENEVEIAWEVERRVWSPYNWKADGVAGIPYDSDLHLVVTDRHGIIIGTIDACRLDWNGDPEALPKGGWQEVNDLAAEQYARMAETGDDNWNPEWACALGASVLPEYRSFGIAKRLLESLKSQALSLGYRGMAAPVLPNARWRMPDLTLAEYVRVRLPDGRHFDPWIRIHESIGGRIVGHTDMSATFRGTRQQWEDWAGMRLPENGKVLIDNASQYLHLEDDFGVLEEGSIWLIHD